MALPQEQFNALVEKIKTQKQNQTKQGVSSADFDLLKQKLLEKKPDPAKPSFLGKTIDVGKKIGSFLTSSEQKFGQTLGDTANVLTGGGKKAEDITKTNMEAGDRFSQAAKIAKTPEERTRLTGLAQEAYTAAGKTTQELIPSSQKSAKQIYGEGLGVAADVASFGKYGQAVKGLVGTAKTAATSGAIGYGFDVSKKLQEDKPMTEALKPGLGTAVGVTIPFASALIGAVTKKVTGALTGAGKDVIQRAIDNPDAVGEAIKTYAKNPEQKAQLVDDAVNALSSYSGAKNQEYGQKLSSLIADKPISKTIATDKFEQAVKSFNGRIDNKGELVFGDTALTNTDKTNLINAWNDIKGWKDVTVSGMDTLRQKIGNYIKDFKVAGNPRASVVLGSVKTELTNTMKKSIPGYGDMLSKYGEKADAISNFAKEFQLGGSAKETTKLNNILKIFKKDPSAIGQLTQIMGKEESDKFLNEISGAILSEWTGQGKIRKSVEGLGILGGAYKAITAASPLIGAGVGVGLAASSPRLVGEAATIVGKAIQKGVGTGVTRLGTKISGQ